MNHERASVLHQVFGVLMFVGIVAGVLFIGNKAVQEVTVDVQQITPFWYKTETPTPEPTPEPTPIAWGDWTEIQWEHCDYTRDYEKSETYVIRCYSEHKEGWTCPTTFNVIKPVEFGGGELLMLEIIRECTQ